MITCINESGNHWPDCESYGPELFSVSLKKGTAGEAIWVSSAINLVGSPFSAGQMWLDDSQIYPSSSNPYTMALLLSGAGLQDADLEKVVLLQYDSESSFIIQSIFELCILYAWEVCMISQDNELVITHDHNSIVRIFGKKTRRTKRLIGHILYGLQDQ